MSKALALNSTRLSSLSAYSVYFVGVFCLHGQLQTVCLFSTGVTLISASFKATFLLVYYMSQQSSQERNSLQPSSNLSYGAVSDRRFYTPKMSAHFSIFYQEWPKKKKPKKAVRNSDTEYSCCFEVMCACVSSLPHVVCTVRSPQRLLLEVGAIVVCLQSPTST